MKKYFCKNCGKYVGTNHQKWYCDNCAENRKKESRKKYCNKLDVREKIRERQNSEKYKIKKRAYQQRVDRKAHKREYNKEYNSRPEIKIKNRIKKREWQRKNRKKPMARLNRNISSSLLQSLKSHNVSKGGRHWEDLVGYTTQDLKTHLESLFTEGMSWENQGEWHIDHIIPQNSFNFTSTDDPEFKKCWALSNLQPLWAKDNYIKGSKIISGVYI